MTMGENRTRSGSQRLLVWILVTALLLVGLATCQGMRDPNPVIQRCKDAGGTWIGAEFSPNPYCALG